MSDEPKGDKRGQAQKYSDDEAERRRDEALKRALTMAPKPRREKPKSVKRKPTASRDTKPPSESR